MTTKHCEEQRTTVAASAPDIDMIAILEAAVVFGSLAAGILILGKQINAIMLFGSGLTILSGLYIWRREIVIQN